MIVASRTLFTAVALLVALAGASDDPIGRSAPRTALHSLDGRTVHLADWRGRVLLVDFWASWCAPCKATFPALQTLAVRLKPEGVDVLAINVDEHRKDLDAFLIEHAAAATVLLDPHMTTADAFGVKAIPTAFVIDAAGTVRFSHPAYSPESLTTMERELVSLLSSADGRPLRMAGLLDVQ